MTQFPPAASINAFRCGFDKPHAVFKSTFHVRDLKPDRHIVACHQRSTDIRAKANLHFAMTQSYPLEIGNHADSRIKTAGQSSGQNFARARNVAFASDGFANRYRDAFAAENMPWIRWFA